MMMVMKFFFFFKQKTAYEIRLSLVGSDMCIIDRCIEASIDGPLDLVRVQMGVGDELGDAYRFVERLRRYRLYPSVMCLGRVVYPSSLSIDEDMPQDILVNRLERVPPGRVVLPAGTPGKYGTAAIGGTRIHDHHR